MTMEVKDTFKVKRKVKEHPNATKYPGRPCLEFTTAIRKFLSDLSWDEMEDLEKGELVFEEEATAEFFDSIEPGDVLGLGLWRGLNEAGENEYNEPASYLFKVVDISSDTDIAKLRNITYEDEKQRPSYKGTEYDITFEQISISFGTGFAEILERDGKPFGIPEEEEITIKIMGEVDEDTIEAPQDASQTPSLPPPNPAAVATPALPAPTTAPPASATVAPTPKFTAANSTTVVVEN